MTNLGLRPQLNSRSLKKKYKKIYRHFFSSSTIAISAPGTFWWSGEYSTTLSGLGILQKIPLRLYVGIEPHQRGRIKLGSYKYFSPSDNEFRLLPWESPAAAKIITYLNLYLIDLYGDKDFPGFCINVLSEIPPGCGLNASGAVSVAIAVAVFLYYKKISFKDVLDWQKIKTYELIKNKKNRFDSVFRLAWKLQAMFHADTSSGATAFAPFIATPYPIIYFSEKRTGTYAHHPDTRFPYNLQGHYEEIEKFPYVGCRMEELFAFESHPQWPIDFGLVYSGDVHKTDSTIKSLNETREDLKKIVTHCGRELTGLLDKSWVKKPLFYEVCREQKMGRLWEEYAEIMALTSLRMLVAFRELFEMGMSERALKSLFKSVDDGQGIFRFLNMSSPVVDTICFDFHSEIRRLRDDFGVGTKLTGGGKRSDILFVTAFHSIREEIEDFILKLKEKTCENIYLDYASWLDGIESEGVKIEQDLDQKIYSSLISQGSYQIFHLPIHGALHRELYSKEAFEDYRRDFDLILDATEEEIYLKGIRLTSKSIHSAKATIKILEPLIKNVGKWVLNSDLPKSSYTLERNELQSKILSPLNKVLLKKLGRKLDLRIRGKLFNFSVKLDCSPINLYLAEKKF